MPSKVQEFAQSFALDLGMDNTAHSAAVQPFGPDGALVLSANTRLSKKRGAPSKSPRTVAMTDPAAPHAGSPACGGIIPCGHMSSNLVMRHRRYGSQRIADDELSIYRAPLTAQGAITGPNQHWSADVTRAGVVQTTAQFTPPAICALDGFLWFANIRYDSGVVGVFVSVLGPDGELVATPTAIAYVSGAIDAPAWVGLTAHGNNGVRLWYRDGTAVAVFLRTLDLAGGVVTSTPPVTIHTPAGTGPGTYDVTGHDDTIAYLLTPAAALASDLALTKVNVITNAVVNTTTWASSVSNTSKLAVKSAVMSGGVRIATAHVVGATGVCNIRLWTDTGTPALVFANALTGTPTFGEPLCGFYRLGTTEHAVFGVSDSTSDITSASFVNPCGTYFEFWSMAGVLQGTRTLPWTRALSRLVSHSPSSGEMYPLFCVQTCWDSLRNARPTSSAWLGDPDVRVLRIDARDMVSCVGRFGVDTAAIYPAKADALINVLYNSQVASIAGDKFTFIYLERQVDFDLPTGISTARYVEMDFASRQPRFAAGADGTAIIAGAMPMEWDGIACAEISAPVQPKVAVSPTGGTGPDIPAGNYIVSAIHQWLDAAGVLHRSMAAQPIKVTSGAAAKWVIQVSNPPLLVRDGGSHDKYETIIYVSQVGGTVLYRQYLTATATTLYFDTYGNVTLALGDAVHPPIYSTGDPIEELMAQAPPAALDAEIVNDRAWLIEAEKPTRLWPSKSKIKGIAYEWSSDLVVELPARAGAALRIADLGGSVAALCTGGVWVVTGPGPDNALASGGFNPPEQVSDLVCTDRRSVIRTPVGIIFIASGRFAMIGPGGERRFEQINASQLGPVSAVLFRDVHEAVWFSPTGVHMAYNYQLDRWTKWDVFTAPGVVSAARDPVSGYVNMVRGSDGSVWQMDPRASSLAAQMAFETGDMVFGGPEDDNVVNEVVLRAQSISPHGVTFTLTTDYGQGEGTPFVRAYSAAEVAACTVAGQYTLSVSPGSMALRALKVAIQETGAVGDAMQPFSLTIQGARNGGTLRTAVRAAGRK